MTFASDQNLDIDRLSATARRMLELRGAVFAEWEKRVRDKIKEAALLPDPILIDTFPSLYSNIVQVITPDYPRTPDTATNSTASEHGGERARLTNYSTLAIISEYQLLRSAIFDVLSQNSVPLDRYEAFAIAACIDEYIASSVHSFALAQAALRERFVVALTHDLRSPLAAASMAAELIQHSADLSATRSLAAKIIRNLGRMDNMIQNLLDTVAFASGEKLALHFSHFDILEVAREVCEEAATVYGRRFRIYGNTIKGHWSRDALKRALENLIGNAAKYGAPGTEIRVAVDSSHERMMLSVHNEGEPIPLEHQEMLFQIFRRAEAAKKGKQQGWGIGLPYVRSVAESHGGSIMLDSSQERGTTFIMDIPIDGRHYVDMPVVGP